MKKLILKLLVTAALAGTVIAAPVGWSWSPTAPHAAAGFFHPTGWTWD